MKRNLIKNVLVLLLVIAVAPGCSNNKKVVLAPYVLLLKPTQEYTPISTESVIEELNLILPEEVKGAISMAYAEAIELDDKRERINFFENYASIFIDKLSPFTPTQEGTYLKFRNELISILELNKINMFTERYYSKKLSDQSILNVVMQVYGAHLNGFSINEDELINNEVAKDEQWKNWEDENLK